MADRFIGETVYDYFIRGYFMKKSVRTAFFLSTLLLLTGLSSCQSTSKLEQNWLDTSPDTITITYAAPPKITVEARQFEQVLSCLKSVAVKSEAEDTMKSAPGGIYEVDLVYPEKTVHYTFLAYEAPSSQSVQYAMYIENKQETQRWQIEEVSFNQALDMMKAFA